MNQFFKSRTLLAMALVLAVVLTACSKKTTTTPPSSTPSSTSSTSSSVPQLTASSFTSDFSAMAQLTSLATSGKGSVAVLLPDTQSSQRYTSFDAPLLTQAFTKAGLTSSQFSIVNAQNSESTQLTQAQAAITAGASVILLDALSSGGGANIEKYAKDHGVTVIDYDRLVLGGSRDAYVSFDNVKVGGLIGQGAVDCVSTWNIAKPQVFELDGSPTDNNATLFAQGYNAVLKAHFDDGSYTKVGEQPVPAWNNDTAQTIFQQQYTAHKNINTVVSANDGLGNSVINVLKNARVPAKTVPVTGQDATVQGMQNVLAGYQCGSVYKPIFLEAQAAAALAIYYRSKATPPAALLNGTVTDTAATPNVSVPSTLLTPVWVTTANMASTVVADNFVKKTDLCTAALTAACTAAGIS